MRLQFDGNQAYQLRAIESVADLLQGQPRKLIDFLRRRAWADVRFNHKPARFKRRSNWLRIFIWSRKRMEFRSMRICNGSKKRYARWRRPACALRQLLRRNGNRHRKNVCLSANGAGAEPPVRFAEIYRGRAVRRRAGRRHQDAENHAGAFAGAYDNVPYRYTVYDSKSIAKVRQFAQSDCVELLVMTIDSFNKEDNVIRQSTDRLQGATPLFLVQSARPVLILDEPQNMESEGRIRALASLDPLFALRYSATHRNPYNLVYRLTPFEAYRQSLVKKIQVASVVKEDDFNQVFVRVEEIRDGGKNGAGEDRIAQANGGRSNQGEGLSVQARRLSCR